MKINIGEIIDPGEGRVVVRQDAQGKKHAHFDLVGLPRVEKLLVGKSCKEALNMTEHLCGICPVAHHLAGTRALDVLVGGREPSDAAQKVRRLLHYGSIVEAHSLRFVSLNREAGISLKKFSKVMLTGAGSPRHFPITAQPGGIGAWPALQDVIRVREDVDQAIAAANRVSAAFLASPREESGGGPEQAFADLALIDEQGNPDVFGTRVRIRRGGKPHLDFDFSRWNECIAEEFPGEAAPRPYIVSLGTENGRYRVGPVAQLSIGPLTTPLARAAQEQWLQGYPDAATARAIVTLHVLEKTKDLVESLIPLLQTELETDGEAGNAPDSLPQAGLGTGLVDGPRGVLAHTYEIDSTGTILRAVILTPTAQNEPWLAQLLTAATEVTGDDAAREAALEQSIRQADPCLPISSAPAGQMKLKLDTI